MARRLYTPRQRRAYRRRQLLRDLVLGAIVVVAAQLVAPKLPFVQQLEAQTAGVSPAGAPLPIVAPALLAANPDRGR